MKFDRLQLENFKCYDELDVELRRGVTVIHGLNGSGKSTILDACFFALYGAAALETTLEDVITMGQTEATVDLFFVHQGSMHHIHRRIAFSGDQVKTAACTLETADRTIDGARDVTTYVESMLRMDAEAFVNCAYVRQGEVNKLIHASPTDRQDMIDELLQLGRLEDYRERMRSVRLGIGDVRSELVGTIQELENQVSEKEAKQLPDRLNTLETTLESIESQRTDLEDKRDAAETAKKEAEELLAQLAETKTDRSQLAEEIEELTSTISQTAEERESMAERIATLRDTASTIAREIEATTEELDLEDADEETIEGAIESLESSRDEIGEELREVSIAKQQAKSAATAHREAAESAESEAERAETALESVKHTLEEEREALAERQRRLNELEADRDELLEQFARSDVDRRSASDHLETIREQQRKLQDRQAQRNAALEAAETAVEDAEALLEAGKCPTCGQPVDDSPHVDGIADRRETMAAIEDELADITEELELVADELETYRELAEAADRIDRLDDRIETTTELVAERESTLTDLEDRLDDLTARIDEQRTIVTTRSEQAEAAQEQADSAQYKLETLDEQRSRIDNDLEQLRSLHRRVDELEDIRDDIEQLEHRRRDLETLNDERRDRLADLRERKLELDEAFDPDRIERATSNRDRADAVIERVTSALDELTEREDAVRDAIGGVRRELDELDDRRERLGSMRDRLDAIDTAYDDAESLQDLYGGLRAELRRQNVATLERMLNETFDLVYQNDSYDRIDLSDAYELTVFQKDGQPLRPDHLSGGERALFNLSLRCAIYRLLAEGIDGTAPMPPLILDEPTVFLDAGHVTRLVTLIDEMRSIGVEQIVVVSHDDELVNAAADLITVEKEATTNRSSVTRNAIGPREALALDQSDD